MTTEQAIHPSAWVCAALTGLAFLAAAPGWTVVYFLLLVPLYLLTPPRVYAPVTAIHMLGIIATMELGSTGDTIFLALSTLVSWAALAALRIQGGGVVDKELADTLRVKLIRIWYSLGLMLAVAAVLLHGTPLWFAAAWCAFAWTMRNSLPTSSQISWKRRFRWAGVSCAAIIVALLVAEGVTRAFVVPVHPMIQFVQLHPEYFKTNRPHSSARIPVLVNFKQYRWVETTFSSQGLRDREYGAKEPGEIRIALLGDLHVLGHATSMEESIPQQLERVLEERLGHDRVRVINAGIAGSSVWEQHGFLRDRVLPLEPDIVLHGLQPDMGISYSLLRDETYLHEVMELHENRTLFYMNQERWPVRLHFELCGWSHVYLSACGTVLPVTGIIAISNRLRFVPALRRPIKAELSYRMGGLEASLVDWYPKLEQGFGNMKAEIRELRGNCEEFGVPYAPFCIPQLASLSQGYFDALHRQSDPDSEYDTQKAIRLTQQFFEAEGIDWIDFAGGMRAHPEPLTLYFPYDGHFTPEGCRVAAELLADALLEDYGALFPVSNR